MVRRLSHREVGDLLGVYALDAVAGDERDEIAHHVADCGACQTELADQREVASLLTTGWAPAPPSVWSSIVETLEEPPPALDLAAVAALRPPTPVMSGVAAPASPGSIRRAGRLRVAAMVGVAATIGVLGVRIVEDGQRIERISVGMHSQEFQRAANAAAADPDARKVGLRSDDGLLFADAVMLPDGTGYLLKNNLPTLSPDRTYQLWAVVGADKISVGVLGAAPRRLAFRSSGPVSALAITQEKVGGVVRSQAPALVLGQTDPF